MQDALQNFNPDRFMNLGWTIIGGWLIWPFICGLIGAGRGNARKGITHGLMWGPLGLFFVLMLKKKYKCPTCGCQTLNRPAEAVSPELALSPASDAEIPRGFPALATAHHASERPQASSSSFSPNRRFVVPPAKPHEREQVVPASPSDRTVFEQACAGYSVDEAARLLEWVNQAKASITENAPPPPKWKIPPVPIGPVAEPCGATSTDEKGPAHEPTMLLKLAPSPG